eukprot:TRINITY_DN1059_c1_g1_i1.p1 TRINITY_DN1059_c1_g1~~TRINITY_DN1059_c1_g1_i1.p1  ORF type:complete len:453 (+),score=107.85 TRINITY_DN1059_c1_g1_i1:40-1398(+)
MPEEKARGQVISDVELVKKLVDALCFSKGGPLPDWDDVYETHCGVAGDIIEEREDLGCIQLGFDDGHKYWYPADAITTKLDITETEDTSAGDIAVAVLKNLIPDARTETVEVIAATNPDNFKAIIEAVVSEAKRATQTTTEDPEALLTGTTTRVSDVQYIKRIVEQEREIQRASKLVDQMMEERRAEISRLEDGTKYGDDALHEIIRLIRTENEDLRMQLENACDFKVTGKKEHTELTKHCRQLEDKVTEQQNLINKLKSQVGEEQKPREPPLLDFRLLRERNQPDSGRSGRDSGRSGRRNTTRGRSTTPPTSSRYGVSAGMRRAVTPPSRQSNRPPGYRPSLRSVSPGINIPTRTSSPLSTIVGDRKIVRTQSLKSNGRKAKDTAAGSSKINGIAKRYERCYSHQSNPTPRTKVITPRGYHRGGNLPPPPPHIALSAEIPHTLPRSLDYDR